MTTYSVSLKTCPLGKLDKQSLNFRDIIWLGLFLIDLEKGKYSTPISYTHPYLSMCEKENTQLQPTLPILSHQRKVIKTLVKFTVWLSRKNNNNNYKVYQKAKNRMWKNRKSLKSRHGRDLELSGLICYKL